MAPNPCAHDQLDPEHRVMMLSGFTGVGTNGVASFPTDVKHAFALHELCRKLDRDGRDRPFEILLRVKYEKGPRWRERDVRTIKEIQVEGSRPTSRL